MARKSLERGCQKLIIWDINKEGLAQTKEEFSEIDGEIFTFKIDLSSLDDIKINAQRVRTEVGSVDILINNGGIAVGKYFHEHTHEQIDKSISKMCLEFMIP